MAALTVLSGLKCVRLIKKQKTKSKVRWDSLDAVHKCSQESNGASQIADDK